MIPALLYGLPPARGLRPRRMATLSVHTSPLDQPGTGDAGGMNVYVVERPARLAEMMSQVEIFTRATSSDLPPVVEAGARCDGPARRRRARSRAWTRGSCRDSCARSRRGAAGRGQA